MVRIAAVQPDSIAEELELQTRGGLRKPVTGDFFPAYDDDGGLLVALAPRRA